jgi:hypothetical protein
MRLLHSAEYTSTQFDDPNLSRTGLVPVLRLMQRCTSPVWWASTFTT